MSIWDPNTKKKRPHPYPWGDPTIPPEPLPPFQPFKKEERAWQYRCPSCKTIIEYKTIVNYCPHCGALLSGVIDIAEIQKLLEELNSKIARYLDDKSKEKDNK